MPSNALVPHTQTNTNGSKSNATNNNTGNKAD
jgi:hypothetical protein